MLIPEPIPHTLSSRLVYKVAISSNLKMAVNLFLVLELVLGAIDILLLSRGYDYHLMFLASSINMAFFFTTEFLIKVCVLHYAVSCACRR